MIMADGEKAYDYVQLPWLHAVMERMGFPPGFRDMISLLYAQPETRIKINGRLSDTISISNGVRQGDPASPLLYLISLQPLLSMIEQSSIHGIPIPGEKGQGTSEVKVTAYADDIAIYLRGFDQLPQLGVVMRTYCKASGAEYNWGGGKTVGLRLGTAQGTLPPPAL